MSMNVKRIGAFLVALAIFCTLLPGGIFPIAAAAAAEETQELTAEDYAQADAVFDQIDAAASAPALKNATQTKKTEVAMQIVMASDSYVDGSLEQSGNCFTWWTESGIRCMYNPRMIEIQKDHTPENAINEAINEPVSVKGGGPQGNQVYLIGPYYGIDASFTDQYINEANRVANAIGDTDGYTLYSGNAATIDAVADAVSNGAVVFFDSHGATDYENPYDSNDFITGATCSYLCLTTSAGLTTEDYNDGAAYSDDATYVNGAVIANHMTKNSPNGILWMAICLGMGTDGLLKPLREKGVEVVYGYSESVTFSGDYLFEEAFWNEMLTGKSVAEANTVMKNTWGNWDWSVPIASYYGYTSGYYAGYDTIATARMNYAAFPVVVSDEDAWPGQRTSNYNYGADSLQTVYSTYSLTNIEPPCQHINGYFVPALQPTCTQDGYTDGMYCPDCQSYYSGHNIVAGGHTYVGGSCTVCGQVGSLASGTCGANVTWELYSTGVLEISGTGNMFSYYYGSAPWYEYYSSITDVSISNGVTSIGGYAFYDCVNLTSVTIPDSVTAIGMGAFYNCTSIQTLTIPDGVLSIGLNTFFNCAELSSITIPDSVESIGQNAFAYCGSMISLTMGKGVTNIGNGAFKECYSLTYTDLTDLDAWCRIAFADSYSNPLTNGGMLVENGILVQKVVMPTGITAVNEFAFYGYLYLSEVVIPEGVTGIGWSAFCNSSLSSISIPGSLTRIDKYAFYNCGFLSNVYYNGTESQWKGIMIDSYNTSLSSAMIHYNSYNTDNPGNNLNVVLVDSALYPESLHSYLENTDDTQTFIYPGAEKLMLVFSGQTYLENSYDYLYIYDGNGNLLGQYTGTQAAGLRVEIPGDTFSIRLVADYTINYYGYSFASIIAYVPAAAPVLSGISINSLPAKVIYMEGEELDLSGLTLTATYSNGTSQIITEGFTVSGYNPIIIGQQVLTVTYEGKTVTFLVEVLYGGSCGENLTWVLKADTLTISGTGAMTDYSASSQAPWYAARRAVGKLVIEDGVTTIGAFALDGCVNLEVVRLTSSVGTIQPGAFSGCTGLTEVYFNGIKAQWVFCGGSKELAGVSVIFTYPYEAKLDGAECSLAEAFANAKSGQTITLLVDCAIDEVYLRMGRTLDLNGCALTVSGEFTAANKTAQLKDSTNGEGILVAERQRVAINVMNDYLPVWVEGEGFHFVNHTITTRVRTAQTNPNDNIAEKAAQFRFWLSGDAACFLANALEDGGADNDVHVKIKMQWINAAGTICEQYFTFREEEVIAYAAYNSATDNFGTHVFRLTINGALNVQELQLTAMLVYGAEKIELASTAHTIT